MKAKAFITSSIPEFGPEENPQSTRRKIGKILIDNSRTHTMTKIEKVGGVESVASVVFLIRAFCVAASFAQTEVW